MTNLEALQARAEALENISRENLKQELQKLGDEIDELLDRI